MFQTVSSLQVIARGGDRFEGRSQWRSKYFHEAEQKENALSDTEIKVLTKTVVAEGEQSVAVDQAQATIINTGVVHGDIINVSTSQSLQDSTLTADNIGAALNLVNQLLSSELSKWIALQGVYRYLFNREVKFDETTQKNILTDKGHKPWFQGDLKFFLADNDRGRVGFKLTFNRGSLPPVFAQTKSFQFGLIFETSEDEPEATKP